MILSILKTFINDKTGMPVLTEKRGRTEIEKHLVGVWELQFGAQQNCMPPREQKSRIFKDRKGMLLCYL